MEPDKTSETDEQPPEVVPQAPADALSRTPDDLEQERVEQEKANPTPEVKPTEKKDSALRRFLRRVNVYFLLFLLTLAIAAVIIAVNYLNSQKPTDTATIESQGLTEETLRQLANTDATVGNTSQTLTIQGNAVIAGQTLMRGNLNVAGNFQTGGRIQGPALTISGEANLGGTQANSLQVASTMAVQGNTTLRDLSVSGSSTFNGPMTASQITVTRLILSGNATLEVPNHIAFTGPTPSRSSNTNVTGTGGSVSLSGSDTAGTVRIATGNNPSAGCFTRVTFRQAYTKTPHVIISPIGNAAGRTQYYVDRDTSGFNICTASAAPANQSFAFDYFVTY